MTSPFLGGSGGGSGSGSGGTSDAQIIVRLQEEVKRLREDRRTRALAEAVRLHSGQTDPGSIVKAAETFLAFLQGSATAPAGETEVWLGEATGGEAKGGEAKGDAAMAEHKGPIKVTISDPESGEVLEERIVADDYCLIVAGNRYLKSLQVMGRTHIIAVGVADGSRRDLPHQDSPPA